jgi:UDP-N-acetylmuramoylalanine--D-glutamate ligase
MQLRSRQKKQFSYRGRVMTNVLLLGFGVTGKSVVAFFNGFVVSLQIYDQKQDPNSPIKIINNFEDIDPKVDLIITSPGINLFSSKFKSLHAFDVPIVSDIELFATYAKAPIIAITGSNGKSTVTTLVGKVLAGAGCRVAVIGNIGVPALSALDDTIDYYVLELSSFQLEHIYHLNAKVGCILNISPDHIDRHGTFEAYRDVKYRLMDQCDTLILNKNDSFVESRLENMANIIFFNDPSYYHLPAEKSILKFKDKMIVDGDIFLIKGSHNLENILAVFAIADLLNIDREIAIKTIQSFKGLSHRCQYVAVMDDVTYINDSKGTNTGATLAAIMGLAGGLARNKNIILLLGGIAKGGDFKMLISAMIKHVRHSLIYGRDAKFIQDSLQNTGSISLVETMSEALHKAKTLANSGDIILFSPACSSFDQFQSFAQRGEMFMHEVKQLEFNKV